MYRCLFGGGGEGELVVRAERSPPLHGFPVLDNLRERLAIFALGYCGEEFAVHGLLVFGITKR